MTNFTSLPAWERLNEIFYLDESEILRWKISPNNFVKKDSTVGTISTGGYLQTYVDGKRYSVHRIVWGLVNKSDPGRMNIDHINGNRVDNRPTNLRLATREQNAKNRIQTKKVSNTGFAGVYYNPQNSRAKPYQAKVGNAYLGCFETIEEAIEKRAASLELLSGEFNPISCRQDYV
jgi:hypothetical protein